MTPIHYRGKVWCVRVPSGAFVARRNGQSFITGNSGFPKRVRLDLKIDQHLGKAGERPVIRPRPNPSKTKNTYGKMAPPDEQMETGAATPEAARLVGWDRALRPGWEPIIVACKPLRGTVAENALAHGTGGLHVDACRLPRGDAGEVKQVNTMTRPGQVFGAMGEKHAGHVVAIDPRGGYPANVAMDEEVAAQLDVMSGHMRDGVAVRRNLAGDGARQRIDVKARSQRGADQTFGGSGGASRFFYTAKASSSERDAGLDDLPSLTAGERCDREDGTAGVNGYAGTRGDGGRNPHPTVKPVALMRWLCRLASPPGAHDPDLSKRPVILDPFFGSGSTGVAALQEGVRVVGVELDEKMAEVARMRLQHAYALPRDDEQAPAETGAAAQRSLF